MALRPVALELESCYGLYSNNGIEAKESFRRGKDMLALRYGRCAVPRKFITFSRFK